MKFMGRCAVVTGAGAGIGETYVRALAAEGAAVVVVDRDGAAAERVASDLESGGATAVSCELDVTDEAAVERAVGDVVARFGGVDILVNNAACHLDEFAVPCTRLKLQQWQRLLEVNVVAPVLWARACGDSMRARSGAVIINQSSIAAYTLTSAYGVSKVALNGVTLALAGEFAEQGVRVNGIAPGLVDSPAAEATVSDEKRERVVNQQLIKRRGTMQDLVGALLFLCSDESSFVTGETIVVGGGTVRRL